VHSSLNGTKVTLVPKGQGGISQPKGASRLSQPKNQAGFRSPRAKYALSAQEASRFSQPKMERELFKPKKVPSVKGGIYL